MDKYDDFEKTGANHTPLSPLSFIEKTALLFPDRTAVIHGKRRYSWGDVFDRCKRLASGLEKMGVQKNDTVSVIALNTPEMIECHYGVAATGAVLNTINVRLDAETIAYILGHGEAQFLLTDTMFSSVVSDALELLGDNHGITIIDIADSENTSGGGHLGIMTYEELLKKGDANYDWQPPSDEWNALALNYTSGSTGRPKGVVYHHRGAHLMALGTALDWQLPRHACYYYVVPLFHCNGWCHVWSVTAVAGTIVCSRAVTAKTIYDAIADEGVTHFGGAPIILSMLINAPSSDRRDFSHTVEVMTAGAPPPAAVLQAIEPLGFNVTQVYGLTETFGHTVMCVWDHAWDGLDEQARADIKSRQGVAMTLTDKACVFDSSNGAPTPPDGETIGEIGLRSNTVMKGYLKDKEATSAAFMNGFFKTGDLAVLHPRGYIQIKDRLKDIIISGGENISSVEIEGVLHRHEAVALAAVVAKPDDHWGEVPCAFVELKAGYAVDADELIDFCRVHLAGFKRPKQIIFGEIPKTSTGKLQKFMLRQRILS